MEYPNEVRTDPRTQWEASMDAKYAVAAHGLAEHYFSSINRWLVFFQIIFTSGAIVAIAKQSTEWSVVVGVMLAMVSAYQQAAKPLAEAAKHGAAREKFSLLVAETNRLTVEGIDAKLATVGAKAPKVPRAIQFAAYNDNLRTNGRPDGVIKESFPIRCIRLLA